MGAVGDAFELALSAHAAQTDKAGMPYIAHVVRVAAAVPDETARIVALLHDVVEDTEVTLDDVSARFGPTVTAAVRAITRNPSEPPDAYYARVAANPLAKTVKLADLNDNANPARLALLDADTRQRLTAKYQHARKALGLPAQSTPA